MPYRLFLLLLNERAVFFTEGGSSVTIEGREAPAAGEVRRAMRQLGCHARSAVVVYEGPHLTHHEIEAPPMKPAHALAFIRRKLGQGDLADVDPRALIAFARTPDGRRLMVDALDADFAESLRRAFSANGVSVDMMCGLAPVLLEIAAGREEESPALVQYADEHGGVAFMLYAGGRPPKPALFRMAPLAPDEETRALDLRRDLQLGRQLFGGQTPQVLLLGPEAQAMDGAEWLGSDRVLFQAVASMPVDQTLNLVPPVERGLVAQRRRMRAAIGILVVFAVLLGAWDGWLARQIGEDGRQLALIAALKRERAEVLAGIAALERKQALVEVVRRDGLLPFRALARIGNDMDLRLVLQRFDASMVPAQGKNSFDALRFALNGRAMTDPAHAPELLKSFEARLVQPPYRAEIRRSWKEYWIRAMEEWANQGGPEGGRGIPFMIEGVIHAR